MDLPDELLDDVLRRIPPQRLAACRRVCGNWRAVIDGRGLVLAHLAPRPPRGIFINHRMHLAFDPTASLHYHVLHFPDAHPEASSLMASYDSTRVPDGVASELWVQRDFIREGDAVVAVPDLWSSDQYAPSSEKRPRPEWELKHQADLELSLRRHYNNSLGGDGIGKSWVLEETLEALSNHRGDHGWDSSDEDSIIDVQGERRINKPEGYIQSYDGMDLLCYHPYKEIVFLCSHYNGFAYYLGSRVAARFRWQRPDLQRRRCVVACVRRRWPDLQRRRCAVTHTVARGGATGWFFGGGRSSLLPDGPRAAPGQRHGAAGQRACHIGCCCVVAALLVVGCRPRSFALRAAGAAGAPIGVARGG
ncbi:hypothetical protein BRADI_1g24603v3 [Brachypodium distachyon]|uniref:F-box domain-containing protein n=1 Tax=Brachypodium distachyon TaxID=15368 RepID=A0A0Q3JUH7_BRADI|nr:hypothetical protein BRADI_1g24603v3 [Brachypodium distachyon]